MWVLLRAPAQEGGQWEADCLDLGVVTYGNSLPHALHMVSEAAHMVLVDDVNVGRDPLERRAPDEDWTELYDVLEAADRHCKLSDLTEDASVRRVAVNLEIAVHGEPGVPERGLALAACA